MELNIGDTIQVGDKQGVINSTLTLKGEEEPLGVWVKLDNSVKYYTVEEIRDKLW